MCGWCGGGGWYLTFPKQTIESTKPVHPKMMEHQTKEHILLEDLEGDLGVVQVDVQGNYYQHPYYFPYYFWLILGEYVGQVLVRFLDLVLVIAPDLVVTLARAL